MFKAKNKLAKRLLAFVLSGAMIFSSVAPSGTTAFAAEASADTGGGYQEEVAETGDTDDGEKVSEETSKSEDNASSEKEDTKTQESSEDTAVTTEVAESTAEDEEQTSETKSSLSEEKESTVIEEKESEETTTVEAEENVEKEESLRYAPPATNSKLWTDYGPFKGSAFGDSMTVSNNTSQAKHCVIKKDETTGAMCVQDGTSSTGTGSKIAAAQDARAMYYYQLGVDEEFSLEARAKVDFIPNDSQAAFGLMARDDMHVDNGDLGKGNDTTGKDISTASYVVAGARGKEKKWYGYTRTSPTTAPNVIDSNVTLPEIVAAGQTYDLSLSYQNGQYTVQINDGKAVSTSIDLNAVDSQYKYVGMFATRQTGVTFDRICFTKGSNKEPVMVQKATVKGNVTGAGDNTVTKVTFEEKTTKEKYEAEIGTDGSYTIELYAGDYTATVDNSNLTVTSGGSVKVENTDVKGKFADINNDIAVQGVQRIAVSGALTGADNLKNLEITFSIEGDEVQATITGSSYSAELIQNKTYSVKVTADNCNDYTWNVSEVEVGTSAITNKNIAFSPAPTREVEVSITSQDGNFSFQGKKLIFIKDDDQYEYELIGSESGNKKALRDGTYTVKMDIPYPYTYSDTNELPKCEVSASSTSYTLSLSERMKWDFTLNGDKTLETGSVIGTEENPGEYHGLLVIADGGNTKFDVKGTNVQFNKNTIVKIPVKGTGKVTINGGDTKYSGYTLDGKALTEAGCGEYNNKAEGSYMILQATASGQYIEKIEVERTADYVPVATAEVTGEIDFPGGTLPADFKLVFKSADGDMPEVTIDETQAKPAYTVSLQKDTEYTISATGANDYEITAPAPATVTASGDTAVNITFAEKQKYGVNFDISSYDNKLVQSKVKVTFTHADGDKHVITDLGQAQLRDGVYSIALNDLYPYMLDPASSKSLEVKGADATCTLNFVERTIWDFSTSTDPMMLESGNKTGTTYNGLVLTGGKFDVRVDDKQVQVNDGTTVKIPVSGKGKVQIVSAGANYTNYTVDGVAATDPNGEYSYDVTNAAETDQYVTLVSGPNTYLKKIVVTREEVPGNEEEITGKIVFPTGETIPAGLTLTFTPATGTAVEATITGDEYTVTLNQGVTYTVSVTGASGYNFTPAKMSTATTDKTITFTKKPAVTRTEWSFKKDSELRPVMTADKNISEGKTGTFEGLEIDATNNGKFNVTNNNDWAQVNKGTIIKVPVNGASYVTLTWYNDESYTVDGIKNTVSENKTGETFTCEGKDGYVTIDVSEKGGYLGIIKVDPIPVIKISGSVTLPSGAPGGLSVIFTEKTDRASKFVIETEIKSDNTYEAELYTGAKYGITLSDETYGVTIPEGAEVDVAKGASDINQDITAEGMTLAKVTGNVIFPEGKDIPADLKFKFAEKDGTHTVEDIAGNDGTYEATLKKDTVYTVTATGTRINDYKLVTSELNTAAAATDITFEDQETHKVTITFTSFDENAINPAEVALVFTNVNEEGYTYEKKGSDEILLRDGTYSVSVSANYPYVADTPAQLKVEGAAVTDYALHFSKRTEWNFGRGSSYMQGAVDIGEGKTGTLDGLEIDASNGGKFSTKGRDDWAQVNGDPTKNPATYTIIKVPADGPTEVTVKIYGGEKYTVDGVENNETANGKEETFVCQGTDGFATITVTKGGYFGYIRVKAIEEVVVPDNRKIDVWDFGGKVEEDTDKYENHVTAAKWISADLINAGVEKPTFKADGEYAFGDLTITHKSGDRLYSELGNSDAEFKKLLYSISGSGSNKKYDDYQAVGAWYCAGTGSSDTRNITIKAVSGDKIVVYAGQHLSGSQYGPNTCYFEGQGLAKGQKDSVVLGSGQIFQKVEFIAEKSGSYKIWMECQGAGKAMYHRVMRIPGVKVSGTIDTKTYDIGSDYTVKFVNQTTKQETVATVEGKNFEVSLAGGYDYLAVLSGAPGYGFTSDSKNITIPADSPAITGKVLAVEQKSMYVYSGKFVGFADGYDVSRLAVTMVPPADSNADSVNLEINKENKTFEAHLETGLEYTIQMEGVDDYVVSSAPTINKVEDCEEDIAVRLKPRHEVTGGFIGLEGESKVTELKFTLLDEKGNPDSNYAYTATVNDSSYSVKLRNGEYVADATVSGGNYEKLDAHVTVAGEIVYKDLMFVAKTTATIPRASDIYVGYPGKKNNYNTVREAVKAAERMTPKPTNEAERITVHIAPGTYREQVIVNTPYITFTNDEAPNGKVTLTWYYGIGYAYYSAKNGFYDEARAHDKQIKGNADRWGCAVQVKSAYFRAENIIFENSFNRYITEEEIADGVEVHTEGTDSGITFVRKAGLTNAQVASKAATERAAAIAIDADHAEFYQCEFYGSQDTVYTGSGGVHSYFKKCLLEGNTDFLFGDSNSVYDECELCFAGYSDTDKKYGGYIAVNQADSKHGYLFTNCTITRGKTYNNGFGDLGRPWRAGARVIFADTTQMSADLITDAGWQDMSGASAKDNPNYYEYNTKLPDGTEIVPKDGTVRKLKYKQPDVLPVKADYFDGWTPMYLTYDETKVVKEPVSSATSSDVETGTTIELSCATEGATIYYAIGESKPADDGWTPYEEGKPVSLGTTEGKVTVWAYAEKDGIKSNVTSFEYNVVSRENLIKAPEASVTPGEVEKGTTVTLSCATEGANIYFTIDGTEPTKKAELLYKKQAIVINKTTTIKAIAVKDTNVSAPVSEFTYTVKGETPVQVEAPTADVEQGKVDKGTKVTLTSATAGAYIRYTTDGTEPSGTNGIEVLSPAVITIDKTMTIKAVAVKEDCLDSASVTLEYTVEESSLPILSKVTALPGTGAAVVKGAKVTLTSAEGADIYYTTDGKDPATNGTKAASPVEITIDKAVTIKAIARKAGYQDSEAAEFSYTITDTPSTKLTNPVATPDSGEVEKGTKVTLASAEGADIYYTTDETDPTTGSTKYTEAITINEAVTIKAIAVKEGYDNSDVVSYTYTVKTTDPGTSVAEPKASVAQGLVEKGTKVELTSATEDAIVYYTLDGTNPTADSTPYTTPIVIDTTVTIKAVAIKGTAASAVVSFKYTVSELPAETVIVVRLEDCEIIVPSIIRNTGKNADLRQPSTTYVTYKYTTASGDTKIVKFAEGLDYEVNWNGGSEDDPNIYSVTLTGLGRGIDGRTVDGFIIDPNSVRTVEYKVVDKPSKNDPVKVVDISKAKISLDASAKNAFYTGYAIEPGIVCKNLPAGLSEKDLSIAYRNNINAGKATVIVSAKPSADDDNTMYVGSKTLTFNIKKAKLNRKSTTSAAEIRISWDKDFNFGSNNYTGTPVTVKGLELKTTKDRALKIGEDYTVTYKNNTKAGKATVTVKGIGNNVSGSWTERITINPVDMSRFKFDTEGVTLPYSPKGAKLTSVTATDPYGNRYFLKEGRDYTAKYTYSDKRKKAAGSTVRVTISGKGACKGKNIEVAKFDIVAADFATCITVPDDIYVDAAAKNLGKALAKATVVKNTAGVKLNLGKDYTLIYDAAAKTITIKPIDTKNYVANSRYTVRYRIAKNLAKERNFVFNKKASMSYDGRNPVQLTAEDIVNFVGPEYKLGVNIEIVPGSYKNNTRKGTGSVTVRGISGVDGGFYGQKVLKFKIVDK